MDDKHQKDLLRIGGFIIAMAVILAILNSVL